MGKLIFIQTRKDCNEFIYDFSYDITFVKIKGFLWYGTESDWYKCYIIWVNKTTYTQTFFPQLL